jgi:hypothetical protein
MMERVGSDPPDRGRHPGRRPVQGAKAAQGIVAAYADFLAHGGKRSMPIFTTARNTSVVMASLPPCRLLPRSHGLPRISRSTAEAG